VKDIGNCEIYRIPKWFLLKEALGAHQSQCKKAQIQVIITHWGYIHKK
jgi:hypothetical protein